MAKFVTVKHDKTGAIAEVPEKALKVYGEKGWKPLREAKKAAPKPKPAPRPVESAPVDGDDQKHL